MPYFKKTSSRPSSILRLVSSCLCALLVMFSFAANSASTEKTRTKPLVTKPGATAPIRQPHIHVRLVSEHEVLVAGKTSHIGLHLVPDPQWHVYWRNPGDSGLAPKIEWTLPKGLSTKEIIWPWPEQLPVQHLMNYGYGGEVVLPIPLHIPSDLKRKEVSITAKASWLVCKEECIPGEARMTLTLPLGDKQKTSDYAASIADFKNKEPKELPLIGNEIEINENIEMKLYAAKAVFGQAKEIQFFPIQENLVEYGKPANMSWKNNVLNISQAKSMYYSALPELIEGVLVVDGKEAWQFSLRP